MIGHASPRAGQGLAKGASRAGELGKLREPGPLLHPPFLGSGCQADFLLQFGHHRRATLGPLLPSNILTEGPGTDLGERAGPGGSPAHCSPRAA